ncbi:hypothetical protein LEP1GSC191_3218 [Leptospira borgpetersenii serovar Mini str. 201000851]|uniref:Uncharacterized protein n=3 Tax=Leptospira borgpetersenii TaxID=174 RepID=M3GM10_LEPBO|nr:hypothetical protein LEP1GSC128_2292 [Leptospira borgpetersenii str. 200801926]EMG02002.1 hypothetical protein LEP1GSC123_0278 [Leptospira borgpetersenii str. 200701203]EMN12769.1 hypothetical protein LEP1GSC055_3324 [Leptospira borgpetersenii str. Brem 307]EMN15448.1 hypothetical protein LEP1GSC056_3559 [Leptospira borgpetersenii str. Brem 328]ENO62325.1 hypothetical protein LEP1GSC191_3218 [Leptospira borgpetersenii serovar Mini str. 201000851]
MFKNHINLRTLDKKEQYFSFAVRSFEEISYIRNFYFCKIKS